MFMMEEKNIQKKKKPKFIRQGIKIKNGLKKAWRRPKGHQSKMRRKELGHRKLPSKGYRNQKEIRGTINGQKFFMIKNVDDIKSVAEGSLVIVSSTIGTKKMIEIFKIAKEKNIKIFNKIKLKKMYKRIKELKKKKSKNKEEEKETSPEEKKVKEPEIKEENLEKEKPEEVKGKEPEEEKSEEGKPGEEKSKEEKLEEKKSEGEEPEEVKPVEGGPKEKKTEEEKPEEKKSEGEEPEEEKREGE